jgi:heme/copper-type cytochrome/quinol oxidase subunit 2
LIALVTFIITALKVGVVVVFIAVFALIVIAMLRGRRSRKREEAEL